jgi:hypothetical protein
MEILPFQLRINLQPDVCGDICSLARENVRIQALDVQMKTNDIYDDIIKDVQCLGSWIAKQVHVITEVDDNSGRGAKYWIDNSRALPVFHMGNGQILGRTEVTDTGERCVIIELCFVRLNQIGVRAVFV